MVPGIKRRMPILIFLDIIISMILTYILITFQSDFITNRNEPETTFAVSTEYSLDQKLLLNDKTTKICVGIYLNIDPPSSDSNKQIIFQLTQNDFFSEYTYDLSLCHYTGWQDIKLDLDYALFSAGESILSISGNNLHDGEAAVLLTGDQQDAVEIEPVAISGVMREGYVVSLECKSISFDGALVKFLYAVSIVTFTMVFIWSFIFIMKKYQLTAFAFLITLLTMLRFNFFTSFSLDQWVLATWMSDYRYGFINRGFAATVLSLGLYLFNRNTYLSDIFMHKFVVILTVAVAVLCIYFIFVLENKIKKQQENKKNTVLIYFWITSPWFVTFFMTSGSLMGRIDVLLLACYITTCLLIIKSKFHVLIVILTIIGVLIYPIYTVIYFPTIFLLMIEANLIDNKKGNLIKIGITTLVTLILTVYFYISGTLRNKISMAEYFAILEGRTDQELNWDVMLAYPFRLSIGRTDIEEYHLIFRLLLILLFCALSLIFVTRIWIVLLKNTKNLIQKVCYVGFIVSPFCIVILFNYSDLMKFMVGIYTSFLTAPVVLSCMGRSDVSDAIKAVNESYEHVLGENYLLLHIVVLALLGVSLGTAWPYSEVTNTIFNFIEHLS